jgi:hypothetical protein
MCVCEWGGVCKVDATALGQGPIMGCCKMWLFLRIKKKHETNIQRCRLRDKNWEILIKKANGTSAQRCDACSNAYKEALWKGKWKHVA